MKPARDCFRDEPADRLSGHPIGSVAQGRPEAAGHPARASSSESAVELLHARLDNARLRADLARESRARAAAEARSRSAEAATSRLQQELAHVNRVAKLGEMAGSIAHEVNQPLAAIVSNAGACLRWLERPEPAVGEARDAVQRITRDARRAVDIVAGLRSLFCKSPGRKSPQNIERLVAEVVDLTFPVARDAGVAVRTRFAGELPAVHVDKVQIQQVLLNLVLNAIDAMRAAEATSRELVLTVRVLDARQMQVEVRDSGAGFQLSEAERMFEAFYTTKPHGMGMGLSISRAIVRDHGGELRAHPNHHACGATFAFSLPLVTDASRRAGSTV